MRGWDVSGRREAGRISISYEQLMYYNKRLHCHGIVPECGER